MISRVLLETPLYCARCSACYAAAVFTTGDALGAVPREEVVSVRRWKEFAEIQ